MAVEDAIAAAFSRCAFGLAGNLLSPRLSILIFHRVHAEPDSMFSGEPVAPHFGRLMRIVSRSFRVMPLGRAAQLLRDGKLPARALAITFDDGDADNAAVALP